VLGASPSGRQLSAISASKRLFRLPPESVVRFAPIHVIQRCARPSRKRSSVGPVQQQITSGLVQHIVDRLGRPRLKVASHELGLSIESEPRSSTFPGRIANLGVDCLTFGPRN
jgi:hypothetical protein